MRYGGTFAHISVNPLEGTSCSLIALAASAQSKGEKVSRNGAPFESEYQAPKTELEYARGVHPFPVAVE